MPESTDWRINAHSLILEGELTCKTLLPLWQQKETLLAAITAIDVSGLRHVDSSGLALILRFIGEAYNQGKTLKITGVTAKLSTLIMLYNLKDMISNNLMS